MVTFKSPATGDLMMLQAHAKALLNLLGKDEDKGIIQVADMPQALQVLTSLKEPDPQEAEAAKPETPDGQPMPFHDEPISLRKRALPLIKMIERAMAADKPIVWGV